MADDLREWKVLGRQLFVARKFIAGVVITAGLLGTLYCVITPPVYRANALLQIESQKSDIFGSSELSLLLGSSSSSAAEIEIIKSRTILAKAIQSLGLDVDIEPVRFPLIGGAIARWLTPEDASPVAPVLGLSSYDWGGSQLVISQLEVPSALEYQPLSLVVEDEDSYALYQDDHLLLSGRVGERVERQGVVIRVERLIANPDVRFQVTKTPALFAALDLQEQLDVTERGKDTGVLNAALDSADFFQAKALLQRILELYVQQNRDRVSADAAASLVFIKNQLPKVKADLDRAANALDSYQRNEGSINIDLETKALLDQMVGLEGELSGLQLKKSELERLYTPNHPALKTLENQIGLLQQRRQRLLTQTRALPNTQKDLFSLTRDVQVASETYSQLLNRAQELSVVQAGSLGNVRILDDADVDVRHPVKPRTLLIVAAATLFGLFLAVAACVIRFSLRPTLSSIKMLDAFALPVYSAVPYSLAEKRIRSGKSAKRRLAGSPPAVLAARFPLESAVEAMRALRTSLHILSEDAPNNLVLIAGATPGVGKTFVSVNLASIVAATGKRVLLIDGDLRRGQLHSLLNTTLTPGLTDALADRIELAACIHPTSIDNLFVMPGGARKGIGSEVLHGDGLKTLLAAVGADYDLVIVDSSPLLVATDGALLAAHCGIKFLVTRLGVNTFQELELALQSLGNLGITATGLVVNASANSREQSYGYSSYYDAAPEV
ncbi:polysaccharide biosynthesis tyrosine autokinase [Pseudomonas oryzihabitans]|uniref:polysaccharide biosynthesis tyrosine autokinase n=1 Tax=Pseudomonas oryzihabitans TaxID=47885 RepID=UPI002862CD99|nr:polysaccharide biosynthesis tyrosine autokinase [Pseudomonas psychrotolerans]MDR6680341.1 tyrosine-protein kinase Etk/Wzc [Pseudomonas psychrotolerans]